MHINMAGYDGMSVDFILWEKLLAILIENQLEVTMWMKCLIDRQHKFKC